MMANFYDALGDVKGEVNSLVLAIAFEEDNLHSLQKIEKELEMKSDSLTLELSKLQLSQRVAESEYNVAAVKKESLAHRFSDLSSEVERLDKKLEKKLDQVDNLKLFYEKQEMAYMEILKRNEDKYASIPCVKEYMDAKAVCDELAQKTSDLSCEVNRVKEECFAAEKEKEKAMISSATTVENEAIAGEPPTTNLGSETSLSKMDFKSIQGIAAFMAQLAEENRLLKKRLESLERKTQGVDGVQQYANNSVPPETPTNVSEVDLESGPNLQLPSSPVGQPNSAFGVHEKLFSFNSAKITVPPPRAQPLAPQKPNGGDAPSFATPKDNDALLFAKPKPVAQKLLTPTPTTELDNLIDYVMDSSPEMADFFNTTANITLSAGSGGSPFNFSFSDPATASSPLFDSFF